MKSCVLLLSLLVPTASTFQRVDQWHVQVYSAAGCNAADKIEDDYKELGVCDQEDANTWKKAVGAVGSAYTQKKYTDSACTTEKTGETPYVLNADCTAKDGKWQTGTVVTTLDTYRGYGPYTDNTCTTLTTGEFGARYHAMNTCQQTSASSSIKYVCTATSITKQVYTTKDCSGTIDPNCGGSSYACLPITSGDVCSPFASGHEHAGKFRKDNCGPITTPAGSASKAWRLCSYGLVQWLVGTALAAMMSF